MKHLFNNDSFSDQQGNHPAGVPFSCISQNLKESSCQYQRRMVDTKVYHHGEFLLLGVPIWGYYKNYRLIINNLNLHSKMIILFFIYYI